MKEQNIKKAANVGQQQTATKANKKKKEERRGGADEGQLHNTARHKLNFFFCFYWNLSRTEREGEGSDLLRA